MNSTSRGFGSLLWREFLHHLVQVEARRLLPDREFLEALDPIRDVGLNRYLDEHSSYLPIGVVDTVRGALEGIGAQVVQIRHAQVRELALPHADRSFSGHLA